MALFHHVEADIDVSTTFREIMEGYKHETLSFLSPQIYLKHMTNLGFVNPIAIFVDIDMQNMDGYPMIKTIQERFPNRIFVVYSAHGDHDVEKNLQIHSHIIKPFDYSLIEQLAQDLIDKKVSLGSSADHDNGSGNKNFIYKN